MYPPPKKFFGLYCVGTLHSIPLNLGAEWSCVTMVHHHWLATTDITQDPCECSKIKLPRASKNPFSCGFCTYDPSLASRFRLVLIYENTTGSRWNASLYIYLLCIVLFAIIDLDLSCIHCLPLTIRRKSGHTRIITKPTNKIDRCCIVMRHHTHIDVLSHTAAAAAAATTTTHI